MDRVFQEQIFQQQSNLCFGQTCLVQAIFQDLPYFQSHRFRQSMHRVPQFSFDILQICWVSEVFTCLSQCLLIRDFIRPYFMQSSTHLL